MKLADESLTPDMLTPLEEHIDQLSNVETLQTNTFLRVFKLLEEGANGEC